MQLPYFKQETHYTCGPACLRMILAGNGIHQSERTLATLSEQNVRHGTRRAAMVVTLRRFGVRCSVFPQGTLTQLLTTVRAGRSVLVNFREPSEDEGHYAIVTGENDGTMLLHDPLNGKNFPMTRREFSKRWLGYKSPAPNVGWMVIPTMVTSSRSAAPATEKRQRR